MALVKVTAFAWVTVIDPFPLEGVGHVTIQMQPGQYKAYQMYDNQADRLVPELESAKVAGKLDYEIEWDNCCSINTKRVATISFNDVNIGQPILLGPVVANTAVEETSVKIITEFDGGTGISVGDSTVNSRLMKKTNNKPNKIGQYKIDNDYLYTVDENLYVYFPAGTPTQGEAQIFVYLA